MKTAALSKSQWADEFQNQRFKGNELRVLAIVGGVGPISSGRIAEICGARNPYAGGDAREKRTLHQLQRMGLVCLTRRGWCLTTLSALFDDVDEVSTPAERGGRSS